MEQKETDDAQYLELLTPTGTPVKMEDDTTKGTRASPEGEKSPATEPQGMHWRSILSTGAGCSQRGFGIRIEC